MRAIVMLVCCVCLAAAPGWLSAALSWDQLELSATPKPTDTTAALVYHFTNTGSQAITILSVKTSCSCTAAKMAKTVYQPGEHGSVHVTFSIGARGGDQRKQVVVTCSDPVHAVNTLQLLVHLPPAPVFDRRLLLWYVGDPVRSQTVTIDIPDEVTMTVSKALPAQSKNVSVTCELKTISAGKQYAVRVTPSTTAVSGYASIDLVTSTKVYHLYARVVPRPALGAAAGSSAAATPGAGAAPGNHAQQSPPPAGDGDDRF
jgi:hypothetical protein